MEQDDADDALFATSYTPGSIHIDESQQQQQQQQQKEGEAAFLALPRVSALPSFGLGGGGGGGGGREGGRGASSGSGLPSLEWVRDEAYEACMACGSEFTLTRRRHHVGRERGREGGREGGGEGTIVGAVE